MTFNLQTIANYGELPQLTNVVNGVEAGIKARKASMRTSVVVFAVLALIAAGAGAALIATSGGPGKFFWSGVGFSGLAVPFVLYAAYVIRNTSVQNKEERQGLHARTIDLDGILSAMLDEEASREQIQQTVAALEGATYVQLVDLTLAQVESEQRTVVLELLARDAKFTVESEETPDADETVAAEDTEESEESGVAVATGLEEVEGEDEAVVLSTLGVAKRKELLNALASDESIAGVLGAMPDEIYSAIVSSIDEGVSEELRDALVQAQHFATLDAATQLALLQDISDDQICDVAFGLIVEHSFEAFLQHLTVQEAYDDKVRDMIAAHPMDLAKVTPKFEFRFVRQFIHIMDVEQKTQFVEELLESRDAENQNKTDAVLREVFQITDDTEIDEHLCNLFARSEICVAAALIGGRATNVSGAFWTSLGDTAPTTAIRATFDRVADEPSVDRQQRLALNVANETFANESMQAVRGHMLGLLAFIATAETFKALTKTAGEKVLSEADHGKLEAGLSLMEYMDDDQLMELIFEMDARSGQVLGEPLSNPRFTKMMRLMIKQQADLSPARKRVARFFLAEGRRYKATDASIGNPDQHRNFAAIVRSVEA